MPATLVNYVTGGPATGTTTTGPPVASGDTANVGDLLVMVTEGLSTTQSVSSITDTKGNTWTKAIAKQASGNPPIQGAVEVWYCVVSTAMTNADTVTVTWAFSSANKAMMIAHFTGVASGTPLDQTASVYQQPVSGSLSAGTTAATTQADELVVAAYWAYASPSALGTWTQTSGFTTIGSYFWSSNGMSLFMEYKNVSATGTQSAPVTQSVTPLEAFGFVVTFKNFLGTVYSRTAGPDTGLSVSDSIASTRIRPKTDVGLQVSESVADTEVYSRRLYDFAFPTPVLDNFQRADENPLSAAAGWAGPYLGAADAQLKIVSNFMLSASATVGGDQYWATPFPADQEVFFTNTDNNRISVALRITNPATASLTCYLVIFFGFGSNVFDVYKIVNNAYTYLGEPATINYAAGDVLGVRIVGSLLTFWQNGVQIGSFTDASISGPGYIGIENHNPGNRVGNFGGGAVAADGVLRGALHPFTDTGLALSDSIGPRQVVRSVPLADLGLSLSDSISAAKTTGNTVFVSWVEFETPAPSGTQSYSRPISDTGLSVFDSVAATRRFARIALDQAWVGLSIVETLARSRVLRALTDTGLTVSDSLAETDYHFRTATDTGLAVSDVLATSRTRVRADTGLTTTTESVVRTAFFYRAAADDGLSLSAESITKTTRSAFTDLGLTVSDSVARTYVTGRAVTDSGIVSFSDSLARPLVKRTLTDTGLIVSDSVPRLASRAISDTGLSVVGDSIVRTYVTGRTLTDTGLTTITDSLAEASTHPRAVSDTGLTISDSVARIATHPRAITDTGLTVSDSLALARVWARTAADTGLTVSDAPVRTASFSRALSDTGLAFSDSVAALGGKTRTLSDTGITITDRLTPVRRLPPTSDLANPGVWTVAPLYPKIDEDVPDDSDYISSPMSPATSSMATVGMAPGGFAGSTDDHRVRYRFKKNQTGGDRIDFTVHLLCAGTEITAWTHTDVSGAGWVTAEQLLTNAQAAAITDYSQLQIEFEAVKV